MKIGRILQVIMFSNVMKKYFEEQILQHKLGTNTIESSRRSMPLFLFNWKQSKNSRYFFFINVTSFCSGLNFVFDSIIINFS